MHVQIAEVELGHSTAARRREIVAGAPSNHPLTRSARLVAARGS